MVMQSNLRPDWDDFGVYRRVMIELEPVGQVAKTMGFEPQHVVRWIDQITQHLLNRPGADTLEAQEKRLAAELHAERVEVMVQKTLKAHAASIGRKTIWRERNGETTRITVDSPGDPKYLAFAMKLMDRQLPLPQSRLKAAFVNTEIPADVQFQSFAEAALHLTPEEGQQIWERNVAIKREADERKARILRAAANQDRAEELAEQIEEREAEQKMAELREANNHPKEECSGTAGEQPADDDDDQPVMFKTLDELLTYADQMRAWREEIRAKMRTVQPTDPGGENETLSDDQKSARNAFLSGETEP